jgi:hypothetical protein
MGMRVLRLPTIHLSREIVVSNGALIFSAFGGASSLYAFSAADR